MSWTRLGITLVLILCCLSIFAAPGIAAAAEEPGEDEDSDDAIDLDPVTDALGSLTDQVGELINSLGDVIVSAGLTLLVKPFQYLAQALSDIFTHVIVAYPDVRHQDVLAVHSLVFQTSLILAIPVFIWIGFQHLTGRADGIRPTVEVSLVLAAGGLAPWLLYYPVELSRLASLVFRPEQASIVGSLSVTLTTALIIWLKAIILLGLVILYVARSFFITFYVAAAPIVFLGTYFRPTRNQMTALTGVFVGCLLIAPFDMIAYRLVLAMLDMQGGSPITQYIWGLGGYFVLLALPFQILSSSSSLILPAMMAARETAGRVGEQAKPVVRQHYQDVKRSGRFRARSAKNRFLEESPRQVQLNHRSKSEVELQDRTNRVRRMGNLLKSRVRTTEPEVELEKNFRGEIDGYWGMETELKQGDD